MPTTPNRKSQPQQLPTQTLISLLETFLADVTTTPGSVIRSSFKSVCDNEQDNTGNLVFGIRGSELRRGQYYLLDDAFFVRIVFSSSGTN